VEVNGGAGRASRLADRRQALPATGSPGPTAGSQDHGDIRAVSVQGDVGEWLPAANAPP